MFRLFQPSKLEREEFLARASEAPPASPYVLTLANGPVGAPPRGFAHDLSRSEIGRGQTVFEAARNAFLRWEQFDVGWVQVVNPRARITPGQLVGVEVYTAGLWSLNLNRLVELVNIPTCFGFLYTTTAFHVEEGQERFVIGYDPETASVSYLIEAVSRPRHPLARLAYPFSRAMQRRFARDSHTRMKLVK